MQVSLDINKKLIDQIYLIYNTVDLNEIINQLIIEKINTEEKSIKDFFGKVEFFDDYNYKELRHRNESFS